MRETAEFRGRQIARLVWEVLPPSHPQAQPVWQRLRAKRRKAAQAARRKALAPRGDADRANGNRPAWSFAQPIIPAASKNGLKTAADKVAAIDLLSPPPKTLPPPQKKKK